jgi:hypothetical protein
MPTGNPDRVRILLSMLPPRSKRYCIVWAPGLVELGAEMENPDGTRAKVVLGFGRDETEIIARLAPPPPLSNTGLVPRAPRTDAEFLKAILEDEDMNRAATDLGISKEMVEVLAKNFVTTFPPKP